MKKKYKIILASILIIGISMFALDRCSYYKMPSSTPEALMYAIYDALIYGEQRQRPFDD